MKNKGIKGIIKVAPMVIMACPVAFLINNVIGILHGASWGLNTIATQWFFDAVEQGARGKVAYSFVIMMAVVLVGAIIGSQILNGISNLYGELMLEKIKGKLIKKIYYKSSRIDPIVYEQTEFLDDINKAQQGVENAIWGISICVMIFTFYLPYFLVMGGYLFSLQPQLAYSLICVFVPVALGQILKTTIFSDLEDQSAPIRREFDYYEKCIGDRAYFKETRLLGGFKFFKDLYITAHLLLSKKRWQAQCKIAKMEMVTNLLTLSGYFVVLYLLVQALLVGEITVGAFAAVFSSIEMMFGIMEEVICRHIGSLTQGLGTINNLVRFLDLPERGGEELEVNEQIDIQLNQVGFIYPGAKESSIEDISLEVRAGETIAVVGENGAGKTTLVKLMTGMYLPTKGCVKIGGQDTKKITPRALYKNMSGVVQKFQKYKLTLAENVYLSDIEAEGNKVGKLEKALEKADLSKVDKSLPEGYETVLSREFDGVDLSGGQWQRVAIARGFYKEHNLIVLDEPTAAIDPIEETRIYNQFIEITRDKTAIIVTHRLGSAQIADRIIVMDKGKIVEIGTHQELINQAGKYKEMYTSQSKWYA